MRMQAIFNGQVIAESDETIVVEGNHYFPEDSVDMRYLSRSAMKSVCPWKGLASYYHVTVDGQTGKAASWQYRHPLPLARKIKRHVAFWGGVEVITVKRSATT